MPRNIVVVSANRKLAETIKEILKKIELRITSFAPTQRISEVEGRPDLVFLEGSSVEQEQAPFRIIEGSDLLILEEASFDSREAALEFVGRIRKEQGASEPSIALATSQQVAESENRLLLRAVNASFPVNAIREKRDLLIRLLYRRFRGGRTRSRDAEMVWKLMEGRAGAILLGTLFRLLSETTVPSPVTTAEHKSEYLVAELHRQFLELTSDEEFSSVSASRLLTELPGLFWVYIAESLISDGRCELESFGVFKKEPRGRLFISFNAHTVISRLMMPDMDFSREGLDSLTIQAIQIFEQNAIPHLYELATVEILGDLVSASLFGRVMQDISNSLVTLENVTAQRLSAEDIWGHHWRMKSWLGVLARAAAFAGYYTLVVSLSRAIHDSGKKEVPAIGTFSYDRGLIKFEASADLMELIEANPQAIVAGKQT